jgi:hypothetical protein
MFADPTAPPSASLPLSADRSGGSAPFLTGSRSAIALPSLISVTDRQPRVCHSLRVRSSGGRLPTVSRTLLLISAAYYQLQRA